MLLQRGKGFVLRDLRRCCSQSRNTQCAYMYMYGYVIINDIRDSVVPVAQLHITSCVMIVLPWRSFRWTAVHSVSVFH